MRAIAGVLLIASVALVWIGLSVLLLDLAEPTVRKWLLRVTLAVALCGAGAVHLVTLRTNALLRVMVFPVSLTLVFAGIGALFGTQAWATGRARAALGTWIASEALHACEQRHGYSSSGTAAYPQVSRTTSDESDSEWVAWEGDRSSAALLPVGSRGVLVRLADDGTLDIDEDQGLLGCRGARDESEIAWIALVSRQWPVAYSYSDGSSTDAERVDVRIVDAVADLVVARVSVGAIPPLRRGQRGPSRDEVNGDVLVEAIVAAVDADRIVAPPLSQPWDAEGCAVPVAFVPESAEDPFACVDGATSACVDACREGDGAACLAAAFTLEHASPERARPFFALACRAGSANACTNLAAGLVGLEREDADVCARTVFERTCEVSEPYGCGMLGRMLARGRGGPEDDARARAVLEADCGLGHSFACEELGLAWHRGVFGHVDDDASLGWLDRACAIDGRGCESARALRAQ